MNTSLDMIYVYYHKSILIVQVDCISMFHCIYLFTYNIYIYVILVTYIYISMIV